MQSSQPTASRRPAIAPRPPTPATPRSLYLRLLTWTFMLFSSVRMLAYLPTMRSNAEIASALSVSQNTVKQHLKSVYRKLSVSSRREAVRVARDAGLLDGLGGRVSIPS